MPRRRTLPAAHESALNEPALRRLLHLWTLRILVPLGGHRELLNHYGLMGDTLASVVDLAPASADGSGLDQRTAAQLLRQQHQQAEQDAENTNPPGQLHENVRRIAGLAGLEPVDRRLLEFTALLHNEPVLESATQQLGSLLLMAI